MLSRWSQGGAGGGDGGGGLVRVGSTEASLRRVGLAVAAGRPALLAGPVGCGKTALVAELARVTGRRTAPQFTKVQLGDQTDSKVRAGSAGGPPDWHVVMGNSVFM